MIRRIEDMIRAIPTENSDKCEQDYTTSLEELNVPCAMPGKVCKETVFVVKSTK